MGSQGGTRLTLFGLRSREKTDATFTDRGDIVAVGDGSRNDVASISYRGLFSPRLTRAVGCGLVSATRTTSVSTARCTTRRANRMRRHRCSRNVRRSPSPGDWAYATSRSARRSTCRRLGAALIGAGFDVHVLRTTWGWTIDGDRNSSVANGSSVAGGTGLPVAPRLASATPPAPPSGSPDRLTPGAGCR